MRKPSRYEVGRWLISLPFVGERVKQYLLDNYNPLRHVRQLEHRGPYRERMYFEQLAPNSNASLWAFKVYTSELGQKRHGAVTTIWFVCYYLSANPSDAEIEREFRAARRHYTEYMLSHFQTHEWQAIADCNWFGLNASGKVAIDGIEMTIDEYERTRYGG